MKTVIGMFDNVSEAQRSLEDLMKFGVGANDISVVTKRFATTRPGNGLNLSAVDAKDTGPLAARGPLATMLTRDQALLTSLQSAGVSPALAEHYVKAVRNGETLEFVLVDDRNADKVVEIMRRHAARYGGAREETTNGHPAAAGTKEKAKTSGEGILAGAAGGIAAAKAAVSNTATKAKEAIAERVGSPNVGSTNVESEKTASTAYVGSTGVGDVSTDVKANRPPLSERALKEDGERVIPILREELQVGKREVELGGVHVNVHVTERPVSEHITLREEHVEVERRPANRVPLPEELEFRNDELDMIERGEEVVLSKQVRVVEEVLLHKRVTEHDETINDRLRSTEVEINKNDGSAYDFASNLRGSSTEEWSPDLEERARLKWESDHPGTWMKFRDSIRYAYAQKK